MSAPVVIVQARMSSRRLPGKVLAPLAGRPMLAYTLDRLALCRRAAGLLVATSTDPGDDPLAAFVAGSGVQCFRGSLDDVAGRMLAAAKVAGASAFVRISGDSPFIDAALVDRAIALFEAGDCDLVTNVLPRTFPRGMSVEVVATRSLEEICSSPLDSGQREHVTRFFYDNPDDFSIVAFTHPRRWGDRVLAVDDQGDLERARAILGAMTGHHTGYGLDRIVPLLDSLQPAEGRLE